MALLTALSVAVSVLFVGGTGYLITRWSLLDQLDDDLVSTTRQAASTIASDLDNFGGLTPEALGSGNAVLALVETDGTDDPAPGQSIRLSVSADEIAIARLQSGTSVRTTLASNGQPYRVVSVPLRTNGTSYSVMYGRPMASTHRTLDSLRWAMLIAGSLGVLAATVAALAVGRTALTPLRRLSTAVKEVTTTDQLNPIRIYGRDELGEADPVVQHHAEVAAAVARTATSADRRCRPRVTHASHLDAHQRRVAGGRRQVGHAAGGGTRGDPHRRSRAVG